MSVADRLDRLGLSQYAEVFANNDLTEDLLPTLTDADLVALGVAAMGHRKRLLADFATARQTEISSPPERRGVVVLFADLVGYTALSARLDPEALLALLQGFFQRVEAAVEDAGGTIERKIGDGVMAVFGAPKARGGEAQLALAAAKDIHARVKDFANETGEALKAHIGVAGGEVVFRQNANDWSVVGSTVNLAARIASAAAPGQTLVAESVALSVASVHAMRPAGERLFKGFETPQLVWQLDDRAAAKTRPFVGRKAERAGFDAALDACLADGTGRVIMLRGEAGIGKTALLSVFVERAQDAGAPVSLSLILDFGRRGGQGATLDLAPWLVDRLRGEYSPAVFLEGIRRFARCHGSTRCFH